MNELEIKQGFWYYRPAEGFPPPAINNTDEYTGQEYLNLAILNIKDAKNWMGILPALDHVKFLWVCSNVNQQLFDTLCKMKNLVGLHIGVSSVKNIDHLAQLTHLKYLHLGNSTKIENIDVLGTLINLKILELENLKKITDFGIVGQLTGLEGLTICGSMWNAQKIDNVKQLSTLQNLKYLDLVNTRMTEKNFDPLLALTKLETFQSSLNYPQEEFEKLRTLPNLKNSNATHCLQP